MRLCAWNDRQIGAGLGSGDGARPRTAAVQHIGHCCCPLHCYYSQLRGQVVGWSVCLPVCPEAPVSFPQSKHRLHHGESDTNAWESRERWVREKRGNQCGGRTMPCTNPTVSADVGGPCFQDEYHPYTKSKPQRHSFTSPYQRLMESDMIVRTSRPFGSCRWCFEWYRGGRVENIGWG